MATRKGEQQISSAYHCCLTAGRKPRSEAVQQRGLEDCWGLRSAATSGEGLQTGSCDGDDGQQEKTWLSLSSS